jgi:hypothetical protein
VPFAAKAFEIIVHTIAREDHEEEEDDSWDSGEGDADSSDGDEIEFGENTPVKGTHGSCAADDSAGSNRPVAGMLAGGASLGSKPPFMGTEQFEARQKEMVKSIMAGMHRCVAFWFDPRKNVKTGMKKHVGVVVTCVCMCVCVYVCMYVCMFVCMYTDIFFICILISSFLYSIDDDVTDEHMYVCVCVCMYVCILISSFSYAY